MQDEKYVCVPASDLRDSSYAAISLINAAEAWCRADPVTPEIETRLIAAAALASVFRRRLQRFHDLCTIEAERVE